jgi:hypothetical protein
MSDSDPFGYIFKADDIPDVEKQIDSFIPTSPRSPVPI